MTLTTAEWHTRFVQQATWTENLRSYLFQRAGFQSARFILEIGCGTGALLDDLDRDPDLLSVGLDIDLERLYFAKENIALHTLVGGDGHYLPFPSNSFDITFCHFLLLWVSSPLQVVKEMQRVTRPEGAIIALAEPDYGGRIDFPDSLSRLGELQRVSLIAQNAKPSIGRQVRSLFTRAGITDLETGIINGQWTSPPAFDELQMEWKILLADLEHIASVSELERLFDFEQKAWEQGERVLFVPTFYAFGFK
jgi:SAM-dependent methyltransferase